MVSDGLVGEGGGCDRLCWGERNPSPAPKPPKGGGGGSSGEDAASSLGDVLGGGQDLNIIEDRLPPSPFACNWYDCILSVISVIASIGTFPGMPVEIQAPAYAIDVVATLLAFESTESAYSRGEISNVYRASLNITSIGGALPSPLGLGLSIINLAMTLSGYPR